MEDEGEEEDHSSGEPPSGNKSDEEGRIRKAMMKRKRWMMKKRKSLRVDGVVVILVYFKGDDAIKERVGTAFTFEVEENEEDVEDEEYFVCLSQRRRCTEGEGRLNVHIRGVRRGG